MNIKPWARMPNTWIRNGTILKFNWVADGSSGTAALILFYALCQYATERLAKPIQGKQAAVSTPLENLAISNNDKNRILDISTSATVTPDMTSHAAPPWTLGKSTENYLRSSSEETVVGAMVARLTYEDFIQITGLSKKLISLGLQKLLERKLIRRIDGAGSYEIYGLGSGEQWSKLPGLELLTPAKTSFAPFSNFFMRGRHELNAMKLYFYYASTRDRDNAFSTPAFPTILSKTGVPEREIPKANSFLLTSGLLYRTRSMEKDDTKPHEANHYYLTGYKSFFKK
ncbi:hypothetical protein [Herminiimonas arsenitoxidans]|uniref:hypothetical protein n=1 Tax=Herminiimonas arsenitoxidans TaxID=1809410 RepID=UPI00097139E2|nr:hypothetical protein [Herminiimonas arsenitoxidans]